MTHCGLNIVSSLPLFLLWLTFELLVSDFTFCPDKEQLQGTRILLADSHVPYSL